MMAKKRIMVVEDEGITAMSIKSSLEGMGYSVSSTVFSGEEAVKKAGEDKPDLVLMDIVLDSKMDGIEAAGQIHSRFSIPVVYLTAHSDEKMVKRIKMTEPFGYIVKPFYERELRFVVEIALYKHEMEQRLRKGEKELEKHREHLVELVEERTSELQNINEKLEQEITDHKLAKAESLRASHLAALGELAAGVAHEINNPTNGIVNYAQILANQSKEGSQEHDLAGRIIKEGIRIAGIVSNLLSFARNGKEEKGPVGIQTIVYDSLALTETQLKKDGIRLMINVPSDLPNFIAHPQQIEQVFLNIISNARYALNQKYPGAHDNKVFEITAKKITADDSPHIQIIFYDRGIGIPPGILNKIMNPFFTTKPYNISTGLGLSISHGIITDHGGNIMADSIEGEFTKIIIELPVGK
jgi:C4-dicarboxylate-specific signal transduction histidine kinase